MFDPLLTIADLHFLGNMELVECQDVGVGFDFSPPFLIVILLMFVTLFSQGYRHLFCCQCQLPTPDNSFGSVEFFMWVGLVVWKIFFFNMFSTCLQLSTSTYKFLFLIFLTFFGVALVEITYSLRKGKNLAMQTSKDLMTMNLGKSSASPSEFDFDRFGLFFFI